MAQPKHTPGPWWLSKRPTRKGYRKVSAERWADFAKVVTVMLDDGQRDECAAGVANATLIAAAPELLEVLKAVYAVILSGNQAAVLNEDSATFALIEATIKKATNVK